MTCLRWILEYMALETWPAQNRPVLETDVFAQRYALVMVHAIMGCVLECGPNVGHLFSVHPPGMHLTI